MSLSRRKFLSTVATAGSAVLAAPGAFAAPYQETVERAPGRSGEDGGKGEAGGGKRIAGAHGEGASLTLPSTMPMGSGAPLGGIGTGFVEVRADGCFYEWQIFNAGPWGQNVHSTTRLPLQGPQLLRFLLRTEKKSGGVPQVRRLYLRSDENDLYTLPFVQDVASIDYHAWFPMTGLHYHDATIPVRVSAQLFSPFIPGNARASATPGFHVVYSLENTSDETVEVSLAGFMDNPLASALDERRLTNTVTQEGGATSLLFDTAAESEFPSGIGNMCFSVTGGEHSYIGGTFKEYALPGECSWRTERVHAMTLTILDEFAKSGTAAECEGRGGPQPEVADRRRD